MNLAPTAAGPAAAPPAFSGAAPCTPSFGALLEARASRSAPPPSEHPPAPPGLGTVASGALEAIESARARLDGLLAAARSGRTFTAQDLMALQGEAYRYAQTVELSAKLVEQGAQAVSRALNAQV
jgi:hypothetical protein